MWKFSGPALSYLGGHSSALAGEDAKELTSRSPGYASTFNKNCALTIWIRTFYFERAHAYERMTLNVIVTGRALASSDDAHGSMDWEWVAVQVAAHCSYRVFYFSLLTICQI